MSSMLMDISVQNCDSTVRQDLETFMRLVVPEVLPGRQEMHWREERCGCV